MKKVEYYQDLTSEDKMYVRLVHNRGKVLQFVVQYYALFGLKWRTIMRVDNYHGFAHKHIYYLHVREHRVLLNKDSNKAFTEAKTYISTEFEKIKENFVFSK